MKGNKSFHYRSRTKRENVKHKTTHLKCLHIEYKIYFYIIEYTAMDSKRKIIAILIVLTLST